jgi:hypothetical protein
MTNAESDGFREPRAIDDGAETESNESTTESDPFLGNAECGSRPRRGRSRGPRTLALHERLSQRVLHDNQKPRCSRRMSNAS